MYLRYDMQAFTHDQRIRDPSALSLQLCTRAPELGRASTGTQWKGLHHKGYITDPVGKARSVVLTDEGLKESQRLFEALFTR